jgi:hypothetical protein
MSERDKVSRRRRTQEHERHAQKIEERQRGEDNRGIQRMTSEGVCNECNNSGDARHAYRKGTIRRPSEQNETGVPIPRSNVKVGVRKK